MKTSYATVHLKIRPSKIKDGRVPIVLHAFYKGKQKMRNTDVWVDSKNWDAKNELIKQKEPNAPTLNKIIQDAKSVVLERLNHYQENHIEFTLDDLFDQSKSLNDGRDLKSIAEKYFREKMSKYNTVDLYSNAINNIYKYKGSEVTIGDINKDFIIGWRNYMLTVLCLKEHTVRNYVSRIQALTTYCSDNGIISANFNPFLFYNFIRDVHPKVVHKALDEYQLQTLIDIYYSYYRIDITSGAYELRREKMRRYDGKFMSLRTFLIIFYLQGLSPYDCLLLKCSQFHFVEDEEGEVYYNIQDVYRAKTGKAVVISFKKTLLPSMLFDSFLDAKQEYLFPFMNEEDNRTEMKMKTRISTFNTSFKRIIDDANKLIEEKNKKFQCNIEPIDKKSITLYSARHTFASYIVKRSKNVQNGGGLDLLAKMMGRSVTGMDTYIKNFITDVEIRELRDELMDDF